MRRLTISYEPADFVAAHRMMARRSLTRPATLAGCVLFFAVLVLVDDGPVALRLAHAAITLAIALAVTLAVLYLLWLPMRGRRAFRDKHADRDPTRFAWSDQGFECHDGSLTIRTAWSDVPEMFVGRQVAMLKLQNESHFIIPRRAFAAEADMDDLKARVGRKR